MPKYGKRYIVCSLQKWMDSIAGQTFLNYAYSWGAAIVIFGTLCKLTHLPGANFWLFFGMGTEVVVFFISAFDRPFEKTGGEMELKQDNLLQAEQHLLETQLLSDRLPDNEDTAELKKTLTAIREVYKQQLAKANGQMTTMENIDNSLRTMADSLEELNRIYRRMIEAVRQ